MPVRKSYWLGLLLAIALALYYHETVILAVKVGYKFGKLHWTKKFVAELKIYNNSIEVYAEPVNGKSLKILDIEKLQPIIKKAFNDYTVFLEKHYLEILDNYPLKNLNYPSKSRLTIIFVTPDTYKYQSMIRYKESSGHVGFVDPNTIYLKTYGGNYSIGGMKTTIRHEIFHYLNNYYGLASEFEETAAKRFGGF